VPDWPLLGRDLELAQLAAGLDDAAFGGALLIGPPGVGKTRLAAHALELAGGRGYVTRAIRATPGASQIPFAALAPLFPEIDLPSEANAHLFQAAAAVIERLGGGRRTVLMVDDAQELDDASAALLDQLVTTASVFVVLTVRTTDRHDGAPAGATVASLWNDEQILRIDLDALADEEMRKLVIAALDGPVDGATVQALVEASGGNVLFLRELVHGGQESGTLADTTGVWRLTGPVTSTPRLRDLISARLVGVPGDQRDSLELIALAEPITLPVLSTLASLERLEALEGAGLVETRGDEVGLVHPLYGELLRSALSPIKRARLCRQLADAAEESGGSRASDSLRAAFWRLEGGGEIRPDLAVTAGRSAFTAGDYDLAVRLARLAWDAVPDAEVGLLLGDALDYAGEHVEADDVLAVAGGLAVDDAQRTALAARRASNLFRALGRAEDADRVVAEAMEQVTDEQRRRDLDALRANHLLLAGDVARSLELSESLLLEPGDAAFAQASLDAGTALALAGRTTEAIRHTEEALTARLDGDDVAQLSALAVYSVARSLALGEAGRLHEAAELAQGGYAASIELHNTRGQAWFATTLARVFLCQGRLGAAEHLFRESSALFAEDGHPGHQWGLGGIALAAGQLGDRVTADWAISALDASPPTPVRMMDAELARARAWAAVAWGDVSAAGVTLWDAVDLADRRGQLGMVAALLHDLVRVRDDEHAAEQLEELANAVDGSLMAGRAAYGRAALTSNPDDAARAADLFEQCGARLYAAEARAVEGRLARDRGLKRRASEAQAHSTRLLADCEGARTPALSAATVTLSPREREVALLTASGLTSREVAERLYLSVRTVENHLQRVYTKLGVTSRDGLGIALQREPSSPSSR
jgi:DNA-binding CsgD family transcriptional regulator